MAGASTARAGDVAGFGEGRAQALTGQFHQAEAVLAKYGIEKGAVATFEVNP